MTVTAESEVARRGQRESQEAYERWAKTRRRWHPTAELVENQGSGRAAGFAAPTARSCFGGLLALVAGEQLDDLLAHAAEVGAELHEHLGGDTFALTDETEEDVLRADVVVAQLERLAQRELEHLLGPRRERDVARRCLAAVADDLFHLGAHGLE